ncbi:MAG: hypothetical protein R3F14_01185 [Polyangiaceae bacterium]
MRHTTLLRLVLPLFVSLAACTGGSGNNNPPAETPVFQPTVPAGMAVYVNRAGQWVPGTVVQQTGPMSVKVHYDGMPAEWDEDVPFERVRAKEAPAEPMKPGDVVLAKSQNRLFLVEIVRAVDGQTFQVHYADYPPEAVENVTADRLQRPFTGATAFPAGTPVIVEAGGPQPYPGKVLAVVAADQWIVRLDGLAPQYDQLVGPDRIRPAGAPAPAATDPAAGAPAASGTTAPAAPAPAAPAPAAPAAPAFKAGDAVLVKTRDLYYPATVMGAGTAAGSWRVKMEGQSVDEEVSGASVVEFKDPLKGVKYQAGQEVFIEWHGVWAPGKVLKEAGSGNYKVRVEGGSAENDDLVQVRRLRPR